MNRLIDQLSSRLDLVVDFSLWDIDIQNSTNETRLWDSQSFQYSLDNGYANFTIFEDHIAERQDIDNLLNTTLYIVLICIVLLFFTTLWLTRMLTRPVYSLIEDMQRFSKGDKAINPIETNNDEIRRIVQTYLALKKDNISLVENLEKKVKERTKDLEIARQKAESATKAKSVFLANMSHELRTPLNAILGFSELMYRNPEISAKEHQHIDIINRSGMHLLQLINDVLDMSKIEAGQIELKLEDFDLGNLLRDVTDMMRVKAEAKGTQLILDQTSKFPRYIYGDAAKLRQILINLLGNAVKFTEAGTITLRLDANGIGNGDLLLRAEVGDTGCGISAEDLQHIFQPFSQMADSVTQKGTGLGLAITRQFVTMMHGEIHAESTPGQGSTFYFEVVVGKARRERPFATKTEQRQIIGLEEGQDEYRILIAEDQLESQLLLNELLETVGFSVRIAENGQQAVELFKQWQPHFIWMDRRMPVMSGEDATEAIRQLPGGQDVKIVALTASALNSEKEVIMAAGMDDFIIKPYRALEIYDCLQRHLGIRYLFGSEVVDVEKKRAIITPDRMGVLPRSLCDELYEAASMLDDEKLKELLVPVAEIDAELADMMLDYTEHFDFTELLRLCTPDT
jgi:signal transduction histidine kinase/CheY-like chemotaxis protein